MILKSSLLSIKIFDLKKKYNNIKREEIEKKVESHHNHIHIHIHKPCANGSHIIFWFVKKVASVGKKERKI